MDKTRIIACAMLYIAGTIGGTCVAIAYNPLPPSTQTVEIPQLTTPSPNRVWSVAWTEEDLYCLALNVYFEARGEPIEGKYAVAEVVMNRAQHADYPNTLCGVIKDGYYHSWNPDIPVRHRCQFSWWCDGKADDPVNGEAFEESLYVAQDVLTNDQYESIVDYALFYHAEYVQPKWAERFELASTIGSHRFYRP